MAAWNALVRKGDKQFSKTFDTKTEAKLWAWASSTA